MPDFDTKSHVGIKTMRPALAKNACVFILVEDYNLAIGMDLLKGWSLKYEASFIIIDEGRSDKSNWSVLKHRQLLVGTIGVVGGPVSGKEPPSYMRSANDLDTVFNIVEKFPFAKDAKNKLSLYAGNRHGWSASS